MYEAQCTLSDLPIISEETNRLLLTTKISFLKNVNFAKHETKQYFQLK